MTSPLLFFLLTFLFTSHCEGGKVNKIGANRNLPGSVTSSDNSNKGHGGGANVKISHQTTKKSMTAGKRKPPAVISTTFGPKRSKGELENELFQKLTAHYRKEVLPNRPVVVKLDLLLIKVKSTIEKEGIFESVVALFIEWHERRMIWDPAKFDNISVLTFHPDKVWVPDVAMLNSAEHPYDITRDKHFMVRLQNDGTMKYVPTGVSRTWCHLQLLTFPFDIQTCSFEFESWSMNAAMMRFDNRSEALTDQFFASTQWTLCQRKTTIYEHLYNFTTSVEIFSRVRFDFIVRRKSTFYIVNLIFPCATLSIIQLLTFTLPSKNAIPDRVGFGMVNILTLVVFQTIITEEMPKSSDAITSLSDYIMGLIVTSAAGIIQSVLVERMTRTARTPPPPLLVWFLDYIPMLWQPQMPESSAEKEEQERRRRKMMMMATKNNSTQPVSRDDSVMMVMMKRNQSGESLSSYRKACHRHHSGSSVGGNPSTPTSISSSNNSLYCFDDGFDDSEQDDNNNNKPSEWLTVVLGDEKLSSPPVSPKHHHLAPPPPVRSMRSNPSSRRPSSTAMMISRRMSFVELSGSKVVSFVPMQLMSSISEVCQEEDEDETAEEEERPAIKNVTLPPSSSSFADSNNNKRCQSLLVRRKSRVIDRSLSMPDFVLAVKLARLRNGRAWATVANRLDALLFLLCAPLAIALPLGLFLPLLLTEADCPLQYKINSEPYY